MGDVFYRGIDPSNMGYTELRYYGEWHRVIEETKVAAYESAKRGSK